MITIQTIAGEKLNLEVDLRLSIEETSVFEGKQGGYSLPLQLPYTDHNAQVLGMPSNIARRQRFTTSVDVIISAGVWVRHAKMEVSEAVFKEHIQCTLFLKESPFYNKIEDLQLTDVFKDKVVDLFPGATQETRMTQLIQHFQHVSVGRVEADYFVFPVCADVQEFEKTESDSFITQRKTWQRFKILNQQVTPDANTEYGAIATYNNREYYVLQGKKHEYEDDQIIYGLPSGYGITPFLKFTYVLRYLFSHLGYNLQSSVFDTDVSFQKMCLLNNTIDAIVNGVIDYSQLVPDVSVSEFFEFIENSFGCEFVIDEMHKTATPRFWNDVLSSSTAISLSQKYEDHPQITYKQPETVKLTVGRQIKEATPTTFETFNELFEKYGEPVVKSTYTSAVNDLHSQGIMDGDFFYYIADRFCYMLFTYGYMGPRYVIEKDTLDYYDASEEFTLKEMNTGFEAVAMKNIATGGVTGQRHDYTVELAWLPVDFREAFEAELNKEFSTQDRLVAKMPFIDSYRHLNSVMQKTQTKGGEEIVSEEEEGEVSLPILPCFYYGLADYDASMSNLNKTIFGSTHRYSNRGNSWGTFDLTTKSLYDRFWKKYDQVIRSSYHDVSGPAQLSIADVMNISFDKQYLLDNQPVLPTAIQYEVSDSGVKVSNLTVKTTKVYE